MRLNENVKIIGNRVILVPYEAKHVLKYYAWMQSEELQELTATEPATLQEEYNMQRLWREDEDKCTFLVLCRSLLDRTGNEIEAMVGDTNFFLSDDPDSNQKIAELEIMIAELSARSKGYGWESTLLMIKYALQNLAIDKFQVKIGFENDKSIKMFAKMRFEKTETLEIFRQITMERLVTNDWKQWLDNQIELVIEEYNSNKK